MTVHDARKLSGGVERDIDEHIEYDNYEDITETLANRRYDENYRGPETTIYD
jgi:hypothetical protein